MALSKADRLEARISIEQKAFFQKAASLQGRTLTDFIVSSLQEVALRVVEEHNTLNLREKDRKIFISALLQPPKPSTHLTKAIANYKKEVISK